MNKTISFFMGSNSWTCNYWDPQNKRIKKRNILFWREK